jgi:hypothetical protein
MLHIEGMGVVGCAVAHALNDIGEMFTWSDNDSAINAWQACTGAIFPADDWRSEFSYGQWANAPAWALPYLESANYWYCTKSAPHGVKIKSLQEVVGVLKRHPQRSMHFNAQEFVTYTRVRFAHRRRAGAETDQLTLVAHGFNARLERYVWGWSRRVQLDTSALGVGRAALYLRRGRFVMAYAYPIPGTSFHYAGSTLLVQKEAKSRNSEPDYERWLRNFTELSEGHVMVLAEVGDIIEGWRPSSGPVEDEGGKPLWKEVNGNLTVLPLWHSGVRWLPSVLKELGERLSLPLAFSAAQGKVSGAGAPLSLTP